MMKIITSFKICTFFILIISAVLMQVGTTLAQTFPTRAIRIIIPFPASGPSDFTARVMTSRLPELLGHPVIFDNRSGAAGGIGAEIVATSVPDGYTLLIANVGMLCIAPHLGKVPYNPFKDFMPIPNLVGTPQWLVIHPSVPARTVKELIALARSKPGSLSFGSAGIGQQSHLSGELFNNVTGVNILHVPYKGAAPAVTDLISGQIEMVFTSSIENLQFAKTGRLRILAITTRNRSSVTPEIPTMAEAGVNDFEITSWNGILAPSGVPKENIARLNRDFVRAIQSPDVKERVTAQGKFVIGNTTEEFTTYIRNESDRWASVVKKMGVKQQ